MYAWDEDDEDWPDQEQSEACEYCGTFNNVSGGAMGYVCDRDSCLDQDYERFALANHLWCERRQALREKSSHWQEVGF